MDEGESVSSNKEDFLVCFRPDGIQDKTNRISGRYVLGKALI